MQSNLLLAEQQLSYYHPNARRNYLSYMHEKTLVAQSSLSKVISFTDVRRLCWLEQFTGYPVYAKFENQQRTGSFKFRGAYYRLLCQARNRPVVVASAGNHGLGIAEAASLLKLPVTICIPATASQLKRERLSWYGHPIIQEGSSVEEATKISQRVAFENNYDYVSPFNDELIIVGQGTLGLDFIVDVPNLDTIVVPIGGGGLASGILVALKNIHPRLKVIGVEPENHSSMTSSIRAGKITRVSNFPTLADGLAANLEVDSLTFAIVKDYIDDLVIVTEEQIAASTKSLLIKESQLVEPSGAVALAALLSGKVTNSGTTGVLLTGGNVSSGVLAKIMDYPFEDESLFRFIDFTGPRIEHAKPLPGIKRQAGYTEEPSKKLKQDGQENINFNLERYKLLGEDLADLERAIGDYRNFCSSTNLEPDDAGLEYTESNLSLCTLRFKKQVMRFEGIVNNGFISRLDFIKTIKSEYRCLLQAIASLKNILDWRSPAYDQSRYAQFFKLESLGNGGTNYNRYENSTLPPLERQISDVLGADPSNHATLLTSSGMAAYSLIEGYLLRWFLSPGDAILLPHYVYFEIDEQVSRLPGMNVIHCDCYETESILDLVKKHRPRVIFLDPMTNTGDLRVVAVRRVIEGLHALYQGSAVAVVIDGTMVSGGAGPLYKWCVNTTHLKFFYHESCSKYLQLGEDACMAGVVVVPKDTEPTFQRLRRNGGLILYDPAASTFPRFSRSEHLYRMKRFQDNAILVAKLINNTQGLEGSVRAVFPLLKEHPDFEVAKEYDFIGGLITFAFSGSFLRGRDTLNSFINHALHVCQTRKISLVKGVSFGFSIPRLCAASAMAETNPPFLRLSVGDQPSSETERLVIALIDAFILCLHQYRDQTT